MKKTDIFDVLIVYSETSARSASARSATTPFASGKYFSCNEAYSYFMEVCTSNGLSVAFTTSRDIVAAGTCRSYWVQRNKRWEKVKKFGTSSLIFDKLFPTSIDLRGKRDLLFSDPKVISYSDEYLFELFFDKQKTHDLLTRFSIPTITMQSDEIIKIDELICSLIDIISLHKAKDDFTTSFILKDRFGAGGNNIFKIDSNYSTKIRNIMQLNPGLSFVLQPYVSFGKGYSYKNSKRATDIRVTFEGQKIVQTYVRMAKDKDFRCNQEQGGTIIYTLKKDLPQSVLNSAREIAKTLDKKYSLFALDFIVTDGGKTLLLEGNNCPGIYWDLFLPIDEKKVKELIRIIVKELLARSEFQKNMQKGQILSLDVFADTVNSLYQN